MRCIFLAIVGLVITSGTSSAATPDGYSPRMIQFASDQWRHMNADEFCPQGHVEVVVAAPEFQPRQWNVPRMPDGALVPCGLGKQIGVSWVPLTSSEYCQSGYVEDWIGGRPQRLKREGHDIICALVRMP